MKFLTYLSCAIVALSLNAHASDLAKQKDMKCLGLFTTGERFQKRLMDKSPETLRESEGLRILLEIFSKASPDQAQLLRKKYVGRNGVTATSFEDTRDNLVKEVVDAIDGENILKDLTMLLIGLECNVKKYN